MTVLRSWLLCLFILPAGHPAAADALDRILSGVWGSPGLNDLRCAGNAKSPSLPAPDLLRFSYDTGIWFPPGTWTTTLDYRVLKRGEDWLLLSIPNEYREFSGKPVVWRLEFTGEDRFHWLIHGDVSAAADNPQIRCTGPAATS